MTFKEYMEMLKDSCYKLSILEELHAHLIKFMESDVADEEFQLTTEVGGALVSVPQEAIADYAEVLVIKMEALSKDIDSMENRRVLDAD